MLNGLFRPLPPRQTGTWMIESERYALKRGYTWLSTANPDRWHDWVSDDYEAMLFTQSEANRIAERLNASRKRMSPLVEVVELPPLSS